jgi:exodeoxyribonuclease VII small subunit
MAKTPKLDFEATCAQLAATINKLEDEQASLEESLKAFEQGITLARQAQKALLEAEQKVQLLLEGDGQPVYKEFEEPE